MSAVEELMGVLAGAGSRQYGREQVSQLAHALQSAALAERDGAAPELVAAALLHDVGHLLVDWQATDMGQRQNDRHEHVAADMLDPWFGPEVSMPVRLHVEAKRYLCATEAAYQGQLSPASVRSLELQGGPLTAAEATAFASLPHAAAAIALRRWDEEAKDPDARTKGLEDYKPLLQSLAR